jgi:hypothetical protein
MKKTLLILLITIASTVLVFSQSKVQIEVENESAKNHFDLIDFYFTHQVFADAFFMTDLYKHLDYDEMANILDKVKNGVTDKDKVTVTIDLKDSPSAKLVFFTKVHSEKGNTFIMMTNFNNSSRAFEEQMNDKESVVRWYYIRDNKLVYRKDEYSKEKEKKKKQEDAHDLIDFYLFDDNTKNDEKVKELIDNLLATEDSKIEQLYGRLYMGEYWLREGNLEKAEEALSDMKNYFEGEKEIPREYSLIVKMATAEFELMKRIKT